MLKSRVANPEPAKQSLTAVTHQAAQVRVMESYGRLPLSFEANRGQTDGRVKFLSRGAGYTLFLTGEEAVLSLASASQRAKLDVAQRLPQSGIAAFPGLLEPSALFNHQSAIETPAPSTQHLAPDVIRLKLVGANPAAKAAGLDELPAKSNYFIGNDPKKWRTNVSNYAKVKYQGVYPGIDLVYYGSQQQLEYDFVVSPGADPKAITLDVAAGLSRHKRDGGVKPPLQIDASGDLIVQADGGEVRFHKPIVYQPVGAGLALPSDARRAQEGLAKGAAPHRMVWGAASSAPTAENRRSVDGRYVLLAESRIGFEVTAYDKSKPLVIDPMLSYSTYLGGSAFTGGGSIAVDSSGNAYVTGITTSTNFPTTLGAFQTALTGSTDVFIAKLNAAGSALIYSTYLGRSSAISAREFVELGTLLSKRGVVY